MLYQGYKLWNSEILVNANLKKTIKSFCKQFQADLLLGLRHKIITQQTEPVSFILKFCHF